MRNILLASKRQYELPKNTLEMLKKNQIYNNVVSRKQFTNNIYPQLLEKNE